MSSEDRTTSSDDSDLLVARGCDFVRSNNITDAVLCFQDAVELNPNSSKAWYDLGLGLAKLGNYYELALRCFERTIELNPYDGEAWNNKGTMLNNLGNLPQALMCYQRAIEIMPWNTKALNNMGILYQKLGNKAAAKIISRERQIDCKIMFSSRRKICDERAATRTSRHDLSIAD